MALETMTKLATTTVGSGGSASIDFTNIPQGYTDLHLVFSVRSNRADTFDAAFLRINGDTSSSYSYRFLRSSGTGMDSGNNTTASFIYVAQTPAANTTGSTFENGVVEIKNYSGNTYKSVSSDAVGENANSAAWSNLTGGLWYKSEPITSLKLYPENGTLFVQHSTATLYGIKSARKTVGNSIKATGGNTHFDGTYVYHTFYSTGSFIATQTLIADLLVVGGGGGGGNGYPQATGGGGGWVSLSNNVTLKPGTSYIATVASGGATATVGGTSTFSTLSSAGGGAGASNYNPDRGGSSGKIINGVTTNYTGGLTLVSDNSHLAGGGGAGSNANGLDSSPFAPSTPGSIGGDGYPFFYNGVTSYFGGGGNGGNEGTGSNGGWGAYGGYIPTYRSRGGGGWGGGQITSNPAAAPTAGEANTGGGGGGGTWDNSNPKVTNSEFGGAGGSGIVIVRYKG